MLLLAGLLGLQSARYGGAPPLSPTQLWAPLPYRYVEIDGVTVAYLDSGGDGKPLLMVHGLSSYSAFWEAQIPWFASHGYRVLALDLPGYGASDRPDAPCDPPWYAHLVGRFMDAMGLQQATIMGHSMGGQIALTLALEAPERVTRLVLAAPAGFERFTDGERDWMKAWWNEERALEADEDAVRANFAMNFDVMDASVERLVMERVRMAGTPEFRGTSVAVSRSIAGMLDAPVLDRLDQIHAPTLIVFGRDDRLIPNPVFHGGDTARFAHRAAARIPGAELVLLSGAGHMVQHDRAEAFDKIVLDWLNR